MKWAIATVCGAAMFSMWLATAWRGPTAPTPTYYDRPAEYDLAAILAAPETYYAQVEPARVWQTAPVPAGQVRHEPLEIIGARFQLVEENTRVAQPLRVKAQPQRPVTFTALDQGRFANGQLSITVPADEHGYAEAEFWVGPVGEFRVLAGSPENYGPAEFVLQACTASDLAAVESGEYARKYWERIQQSPHADAIYARPAVKAAAATSTP
jgi:hypothetical protein